MGHMMAELSHRPVMPPTVPVDLTQAAVAAKEQSPDEKEQERRITDPAQRVLAAL